MSAAKLSTDEVPQKFAERLLDMGCPVEKVPTSDKMKLLSRGRYYMVWRSLIEHVQVKDTIREKRLHVYYDNLKLCKENNAFKECDSKIVVPEPVQLWKQQMNLKERVTDDEKRVEQAQETLNELMSKISSIESQRKAARCLVEDLQRRVWLLREVSNELTSKKVNLIETKAIAESLCNVGCDQDLQSKIEKYLTSMQKKQSAIPLSNPVASSSIVSTYENENFNDKEDNLRSLVKCRCDALWPHLYAKREALVTQLLQIDTKNINNIVDKGITPQSVVAHIAGLHSNIALEVMKNKLLLKQTKYKVAESVEEISIYTSSESSELLVLRCERANTGARVKSLNTLYKQLTSKSGIFHISVDDENEVKAIVQKIASIDKGIESTRDEIKILLTSLATTERKIYNIQECLVTVFRAFHTNSNVNDYERYKGIQLDFPIESISMLRQYYAVKCEKNKNDGNKSLDLDLSEDSFSKSSDSVFRFIDELRVYLKNFKLEKNRKFVLDSGEKIWTIETLQSILSNLNTSWLHNTVTLFCPSVRLSHSLRDILDKVQEKDKLTNILNTLSVKKKPSIDIDITSKVEYEAEISDKLKKQMSENLLLLQKVSKTLNLCQENLRFWSENVMKKYISDKKKVKGKTYRDYEAIYLEHIKFNC